MLLARSQIPDSISIVVLAVSSGIAEIREEQNLPLLDGCAPATYCIACRPYGDPGSIYTLIPIALGAVVVNASRSRYVVPPLSHISRIS